MVHKGSQSANVLEASPAIFVDPSTGETEQTDWKSDVIPPGVLGRTKVVVSTTETKSTQGEFFVSNFKLQPHRYYDHRINYLKIKNLLRSAGATSPWCDI